MPQHATQLDGQLVGERIRQARVAAEISNSELARRAHVGERTVFRWQAGVLMPSLAHLLDLCAILDRDVTYFLGDEEQAA